jgi:teichuronic acid biosynthesis glycosyltransferase TuaC
VAIRTLTFTTLYPSETIPHHGIFVEQRLRHLLQGGEVETRVVAPVPWFPFKHRSMGEYGLLASIPRSENRHGIDIAHPRFPLIPKFGMSISPVLMALALRSVLKAINVQVGGFDLIDAHYFYPDGVTAVLLGRWLNKPVVITARGTDINLIPEYAVPRKWILWAARHCAAMITVSDALRDRLIELGADAAKVQTLRNGVDLDLFRPLDDRDGLRSKLGMNRLTLLSVGHLIERKGHHLIIKALAELPQASLVIAGTGELQQELEHLAADVGVSDRVSFAGSLSHDELVEYYNAADALVLASSREGMANVILESIACGTPVIGTPIWGTPEVISESSAGVLTGDRSSEAIVAAVNELMRDLPPRDTVREFALRFSWDNTTQGQLDVFRTALSGS